MASFFATPSIIWTTKLFVMTFQSISITIYWHSISTGLLSMVSCATEWTIVNKIKVLSLWRLFTLLAAIHHGHTVGALACMCRMYRSVHPDVMCRACLFASGWVRAHTIGISRLSRPKLIDTYRPILDKMAIVAVSLATIPDSLATLLFVNT